MNSEAGTVREVEIGPDHSGQRVDNFLSRELGSIPRSLVYRLIRTGQVRINGGRVKPMRKLKLGDRVRIPPVRNEQPARSLPPGLVEQIRASVVHRRDELLVLDKPSGIASQGGSGLAFGLNDLVAASFEGAVPVHRLDRETSGLMVFARGRAAAAALQQAFREQRVEKRYLALLSGHLAEDRVSVDAPLKKIRDGSGQHRVIVAEDGDPARSEFRLLERFDAHDFVEVGIETGRTHQIRAHAAHLGAPVAGDQRYNDVRGFPGLDRLFLHAGFLRLPWPDDQVFNAPLPEALARVLGQLRRN